MAEHPQPAQPEPGKTQFSYLETRAAEFAQNHYPEIARSGQANIGRNYQEDIDKRLGDLATKTGNIALKVGEHEIKAEGNTATLHDAIATAVGENTSGKVVSDIIQGAREATQQFTHKLLHPNAPATAATAGNNIPWGEVAKATLNTQKRV